MWNYYTHIHHITWRSRWWINCRNYKQNNEELLCGFHWKLKLNQRLPCGQIFITGFSRICQIRSQFCTWHNSWAVMISVKLWPHNASHGASDEHFGNVTSCLFQWTYVIMTFGGYWVAHVAINTDWSIPCTPSYTRELASFSELLHYLSAESAQSYFMSAKSYCHISWPITWKMISLTTHQLVSYRNGHNTSMLMWHMSHLVTCHWNWSHNRVV